MRVNSRRALLKAYRFENISFSRIAQEEAVLLAALPSAVITIMFAERSSGF